MTVQRLAAPAVVERGRDSLQFRAIFALSFSVFFVFALVSRLAPAYWRDVTRHRSIFADACAGAGTTAQMAFAG